MRLPSVTEVLSPWQDFSRVRPDVLEMARDRGSKVYQICAALALDLWVPEVPAECAPYIDSFLGWFPVVEKVVAVEPELVCPKFRFKGHPDLICVIRGDKGLVHYGTLRNIVDNYQWKQVKEVQIGRI